MSERRTFGQILQAQKGSAGLHRSLVLLPDEEWALRAYRGGASNDTWRRKAQAEKNCRLSVVHNLAKRGSWPAVNYVVNKDSTAKRSAHPGRYAVAASVCFFLATVVFVLWQIA